ncbi:MAG TPA: hypothetical protein VF228_20195 [Iamia sp.]
MTNTWRRRRIITPLLGIIVIAGLAACEVNLDGDISQVNIQRFCTDEPGRPGPGPYFNQVTVTVDSGAGEDFDILIAVNNSIVTGLSDVSPGSGLLWTDRFTNATVIDVAVVPSDGTGPDDTYHQIFNACPPA